MKKTFFLSIGYLIVLFACGTKEEKQEAVYPKAHYVSIFKTPNLKTDERLEYLTWGTKLLIEEIVSITNIPEDQKKTNIINSFKVFNKFSKTRGYVAENDVIRNPLMKGVIINSTTASETPNMASFNKKSLKPFILVYIIGISEDKELYNIAGYTSKSFVLPEEEENITPIWKPLWVYKADVSTNQQDIELIIIQQLSVKRYKDSLVIYNKNPDNAKIAKEFTNIVKREIDEIRIALNKFNKGSSAVNLYLSDYQNKLETFLTGKRQDEESEEEYYEEEVSE